MTKPKFGKWTKVEDGLPEFETQAGGLEFVFVLAQYKDGRVMETERNSKDGWRPAGMGVSHEIVAWMPKPRYNEDAFTELRAKLVELEQVYKKDLVNLDAGTRTANLSQHREIKIACCRTALLVIKNIREIIE